ncbi:MAG: gamma-glutamyl-gamma-aminobutyrate hydrolase family protein [Phycisphaerales bacterium]|nr:gamma-glutamyl-gamma-aminobutyrate hydrolase family protein [Phycisphaerales bacterium]
MRRPLIGVTGDIEPVAGSATGAYRVRTGGAYLDAVVKAGGVPVVMHPDVGLATDYAKRFDGFLLTGGNDPDTTAWGVPMHPKAVAMHAQRQRFEVELLKVIDATDGGNTPTLGVCMGMQLMGVHRAGIGALVQHLGDVVPTAGQHGGEGRDAAHPITATADWARSELATITPDASVTSHHHQAVDAAAISRGNKLRVLALCSDGVVEAFDDPERPFYVGVQWHPERTPDRGLGQGVIDRLVEAARRRMPKAP